MVRSRHAGRSLLWLIGALSAALVGLLLFGGETLLPPFFTIIAANEAILISFFLLHQAAATVLDSPRRYVGMSALLVIAVFFAYLFFTYDSPSIRDRILVRTTAIFIQVAATTLVLFRHKHPLLRNPIRVAAWVLFSISLLQFSRLVATLLWAPSPDRLHPDAVQAFYILFSFLLSLASALAVVWLALSAQRHVLQIMATTDGLSNLLNRRTFDELLERRLQRRERSPDLLALLLIDLDHFKAINDQYGHPMGDEVIRRVSQLLRINTREIDTVARYGGEEFAMVVQGMQLEQVESIAERLRTQIEAMVGFPETITVTASFGIAMREADDTVTSLTKRSDEALYLSKRSGRNRVTAGYAYSV
jgi:diguanylate cyclase (GGDEF)-like protein